LQFRKTRADELPSWLLQNNIWSNGCKWYRKKMTKESIWTRNNVMQQTKETVSILKVFAFSFKLLYVHWSTVWPKK